MTTRIRPDGAPSDDGRPDKPGRAADGAPTQPAAPEATGRRRALSPSRAADFKLCPLKYRFRAIDRIPEPPSHAAARGTLVHSILEKLFARPAQGRTEAWVADAVPVLWSALLDRSPDLGGLVDDADLDGWFAAARGLVHTYFSLEDPARFDPDGCELRLEVTVRDDVPLRGFVDRVDVSAEGLVRIVDYKTGKAPPPAYVGDAMFQLKFYALMWYRLRGTVPARLRLIYLGNGELVEYTPDETELAAFERSVASLWSAVERAAATGDFPPRRNRLCRWCSFQHLCPAFGGTPPPYPGAGG
jgi:putative RecB family exonuclease